MRLHSRPIPWTCRASQQTSQKGPSLLRAKALKTSPPGSFPWGILGGTWHPAGRGKPEPTAILQCVAVLRATVSVLCGSHSPGVEKGWSEKSSLTDTTWSRGRLSPGLANFHQASVPARLSCGDSQPPNPGAYDGQGLLYALVTNTLIRGWVRGPVNMSSPHDAG